MSDTYTRTLGKWLKRLIILSAVAVCMLIFAYTPFYSRMMLWAIEQLSQVQVDPVAARSQNSGNLSLDNSLEPGSPEWVARQAYLTEINKAMQHQQANEMLYLQQRYELLQTVIAEQKLKQQEQQKNTEHQDDEETENDNQLAASVDASKDYYQQLFSDKNTPLLQQYRAFLTVSGDVATIGSQDIAQLEKQAQKPLVLQLPAHQPHAIIVLGGGLTSGKKKGEIVINPYTQKRLETVIEIYKKYPLPILLSGVEAPYMQKWLEQHDVKAQFLENRSMNTCENTRFSALMLQKQGGAPTVFLITDAYHMPRTRQYFAQNGIETIPVIAPLPNTLTAWQPSRQNWMHSRRANYEFLAMLYGLWFGEKNCREIP